MHPLLVRKLKLLSLFCLFSIFAGIIFQRLNNGFIDHNAFIVGFVMGLGFGVLELFMMTKLNQRIKTFPIPIIIITKTIAYTIIIFLISNVLGLLAGLFEGKEISEFYDSLTDRNQFHMIFYSLAVFTIIIFFLQISRLLGEGKLIKFLLGKYYKPVEEERIFMFLDMKSSTTLAEKLGLKQYYSLLNTFFSEITEPVLTRKAEIYQYVGDEVVFTWTTKDGLKDANCIQLFFSIKNNVNNNREYYLDKYGVVPQFKAGMHFGNVIVGQIGDLKREIVYNGDVLNTTARIQELCNEYNKELLISRKLLVRLKLSNEYKQESLGKVMLRGKETETHIYGITQNVK